MNRENIWKLSNKIITFAKVIFFVFLGIAVVSYLASVVLTICAPPERCEYDFSLDDSPVRYRYVESVPSGHSICGLCDICCYAKQQYDANTVNIYYSSDSTDVWSSIDISDFVFENGMTYRDVLNASSSLNRYIVLDSNMSYLSDIVKIDDIIISEVS